MTLNYKKKIFIEDKILIAGATGMAGSAINKIFRKLEKLGNKEN